MPGTRFEYHPSVLRYGTGCVGDLGGELDRQGFERALVVCGQTVGQTDAVIDPVREGLDGKLAGVFAETTPKKRLSTAYDAVDALDAHDADVLVGLGGGSSLDVAKTASVLAGDDRSLETVARELADTGTISIPEGALVPIVAVPTTLAGADLSTSGGVTAGPESRLDSEVGGGVSDQRLMPRAVVADPALVATTPGDVLAASAMNGFDKGIESLYARNATAVTDATAMRGLSLLAETLPEIRGGDADVGVFESVVEGILLVQYGIARPDEKTLSLVHAFGHGLTRTDDLQQGVAHGVVAPHALRYLFEEVDGRRELLADALGVGDAPIASEAVVGAVESVRDGLGLPSRLRDVDGPTPEEFPAVAQATLDDPFMANTPDGFTPTVEELVGVLEAAY